MGDLVPLSFLGRAPWLASALTKGGLTWSSLSDFLPEWVLSRLPVKHN